MTDVHPSGESAPASTDPVSSERPAYDPPSTIEAPPPVVQADPHDAPGAFTDPEPTADPASVADDEASTEDGAHAAPVGPPTPRPTPGSTARSPSHRCRPPTTCPPRTSFDRCHASSRSPTRRWRGQDHHDGQPGCVARRTGLPRAGGRSGSAGQRDDWVGHQSPHARVHHVRRAAERRLPRRVHRADRGQGAVRCTRQLGPGRRRDRAGAGVQPREQAEACTRRGDRRLRTTS